jgi:hypothetical protein
MASESVSDWLRRGGPWGRTPSVVETHAALVFLVGDFAYKVKKPVDLGYLDFTTLERRHATLARELTLNRRTAPATYLKLVPVARSEGTFALGGEGQAVEWLLEMRRFPDEALLARLADRGELAEAMIEQLATHTAQFHDGAEVVRGYDWPAAVARIARENASDLASQTEIFVDRDLMALATARTHWLETCARTLSQQSADVRHCHGDMHLGNAFLDHGTPTLFDCIEFDDFYATIPPLYDVAFLLMDLLSRGAPRFANRALNAWTIARAPDHWRDIMASLAALPLYLALRAEIRAKTEGRRPSGRASARRYLDLAAALYAPQPQRLIAIGGLSGTGKSSLAKNLAWRIGGGAGAMHLRTDEIRKRLVNVPLTERLSPSAYTQAASDRVYAQVADLARAALAAGHAVVVDAVFARESERAAIAELADRAGVPFTGLWLEAPQDVLEQRLARRTGDASDADAAVLRKQLAYELGTISWHCVDAGQTERDTEQNALALLGVAQ